MFGSLVLHIGHELLKLIITDKPSSHKKSAQPMDTEGLITPEHANAAFWAMANADSANPALSFCFSLAMGTRGKVITMDDAAALQKQLIGSWMEKTLKSVQTREQLEFLIAGASGT